MHACFGCSGIHRLVVQLMSTKALICMHAEEAALPMAVELRLTAPLPAEIHGTCKSNLQQGAEDHGTAV